MTIDTKYNIGQKVWTTDYLNRPIQGEISAVNPYVSKRKTENWTSYYIIPNGYNCGVMRREQHIFPSKEELLKFMIEKV